MSDHSEYSRYLTDDAKREIERVEYDDRRVRLDLERAGPDHTSGVMRCRFQVLGGHVHCAIFGPFSGKAGDLTFRVSEWDHFRTTHPNWQFQESEHVV